MTNKSLFVILFTIFLVSCVKEALSDLTKNKILLAGTGGVMSTYRVWKLDSAIKNNQVLTEKDIKEGYILTCQSLPQTKAITINNP